MRFTEFLKTAVLLFAASATALGVVAILGATSKDDNTLIYFSAAWWCAATLTGIFVGRRMRVTDGIARLLADAPEEGQQRLEEARLGEFVVARGWRWLARLGQQAGQLGAPRPGQLDRLGAEVPKGPDGRRGRKLALAELVDRLGLESMVVNRDPAPSHLGALPGV